MISVIQNIFNIQLNIEQLTFFIDIAIYVSIFYVVIKIPQVKLVLNDTIIKPLSYCFGWLQEFWIATDITSKLQIYSKRLNIPGLEIKKKSIKVTFVKHFDKNLPENEKIFLMSDSKKHQEKNLTKATIQFVEKNMIPRCRQTLTEDMELGVKITFARKIFNDNKELAALDYLMSKFLPEEYQSKPNLEQVMKDLVTIDEGGVFATILMHQYFRLNSEILNTVNLSQLKAETLDFKNYLLRIVTRDRHQQVTLRFTGSFIKVFIILIGGKQNLSDMDGNKYIQAVRSDHASDTVYLIAPAICNDFNITATTELGLKMLPKIAKRLESESGFKLIDILDIPLRANSFNVKVATFLRKGK